MGRSTRLAGSTRDTGGAGGGGPASARAKHALVLSREQAAGRAIAARVIERPKPSVWMFLVPVLLVDHVYRFRTYRAGLEAFARECTRARAVALDAALAAVERGIGKAEAMGALERDDGAVLPDGAAAARRAQRREIEVLFDHYARLLRAEGDRYEDLVRHAYASAAAYERFLDALRAAERETGQAARHSLASTEGSSELLARMQEAVEDVRTAEARAIFS